jgi:hypothetical protein
LAFRALFADPHRAVDPGHAGSLPGNVVYGDEAFLAHAHAAEDTALCASCGDPERLDPVPGQGRGDRLARTSVECLALELDPERLAQ